MKKNIIFSLSAIIFALCLFLLYSISPENIIYPSSTCLLILILLYKITITAINTKEKTTIHVGRNALFKFEFIASSILALLFIVAGMFIESSESWAGISFLVFIGIDFFILRFLIFDGHLFIFTKKRIIINESILKKTKIDLSLINNVIIRNYEILFNCNENDILATHIQELNEEDKIKLCNAFTLKKIKFVCD